MNRNIYARSLVGALVAVAVLVMFGSGAAAASDNLTTTSEQVQIQNQNDTVTIDVEFSPDLINDTTDNGTGYAVVDVSNASSGSFIDSQNLTVDETDFASDYENDTAWESAEFTRFDSNLSGHNVTVEISDESAPNHVNDTVVSVNRAGGVFGGVLGGATQTQVLGGVIALVLGVLAFKRMDG